MKKDPLIKRLCLMFQRPECFTSWQFNEGNLLDSSFSVSTQVFGSAPQRECLNVVPLSVLKAIFEYTWNQVTKMYYSVALPIHNHMSILEEFVFYKTHLDGKLHHKSQASLILCLITSSQRYLRAIICHSLPTLSLSIWATIWDCEEWKMKKIID